MSDRRWLSQAEAAEYLGVTDRTIRRYIAAGVVKGRRLPGSRLIRIDRRELDAALTVVPNARSTAAACPRPSSSGSWTARPATGTSGPCPGLRGPCSTEGVGR